jgi:NAD(P)-dependent dehydrogenase (short-subunit alcohol dehydrogenase family)
VYPRVTSALAFEFAFNNAGVLATGFTHGVEEDDFDRIVALDLKGVWLCMKYELAGS